MEIINVYVDLESPLELVSGWSEILFVYNVNILSGKSLTHFLSEAHILLKFNECNGHHLLAYFRYTCA